MAKKPHLAGHAGVYGVFHWVTQWQLENPSKRGAPQD
jgi:hypothetical protein